MRHISGHRNIIADSLSREESGTLTKQLSSPNGDHGLPCLFGVFTHAGEEELRAAQEKDEELSEILKGDKYSLKLTKYNQIWCHSLNGTFRPFVPKPLRKGYFQNIHGLSHPGTKATARLLCAKYVWPGSSRDARDWTRECESCQKSKVTRHNKAKVENIPPISEKFSQIHVDIVGPLPSNNGYKYLLTMIDRFTRWPEAVPMKDIVVVFTCGSLVIRAISYLYESLGGCGCLSGVTRHNCLIPCLFFSRFRILFIC